MGMLLALLGLAYGQTYNVGDYRANSGTPKVSSATGWQIYDGTNWVAASQSPLAYQQPFTNKIYVGAAAGIEVDNNFVLHGNFISPVGTKKMLTVKAGKTFEFGVNLSSKYDFCDITVEAGARFINNGHMDSVGMTSKILLKAGSSMDGGRHHGEQWVDRLRWIFRKRGLLCSYIRPKRKNHGHSDFRCN